MQNAIIFQLSIGKSLKSAFRKFQFFCQKPFFILFRVNRLNALSYKNRGLVGNWPKLNDFRLRQELDNHNFAA